MNIIPNSITTALLFCCLACSLFPTEYLRATQENARHSNDEIDWLADLDYLASQLPKKHVDLFRSREKKAFDNDVRTLRATISEMSRAEATLNLMKLVASVKDGHTLVRPEMNEFHFFPFNAIWFDDGVFVTYAAKGHESILKAKIVKIGSLRTEEVQERMGKLIASDNLYGLKSILDNQFNTAEYLKHIGAIEDVSEARIEFEKSGKSFFVEMKAISVHQARTSVKWQAASQSIPLYKQKARLPFWNDFISDSKTLYFKYNRCVDLASFKLLVDGTAGFIKQNQVDRFVLDLRDNSGGNSAVFKPLLEYLSGHDSINEKGKLFVIVGRGTFSSGIWAAMDMKQTNAVFVGEPTSGKPNHFGEVKSFKLPNSGLMVFYSTREWNLFPEHLGDTFEPDEIVEFNSQDFFQGKDPALEAILKWKK